MHKFSSVVKNQIGLSLSDNELHDLFNKYYISESDQVDYNRFFSDYEKISRNQTVEVETVKTTKKTRSTLNLKQIIGTLNSQLQSKLSHLQKEQRGKRAYLLLSESRSTTLTRAQLKSVCKFRLSIVLNDDEVNEVFNQLDPYKTGTILTKKLLKLVFSDSVDKNSGIASSLQFTGESSGSGSSEAVGFSTNLFSNAHTSRLNSTNGINTKVPPEILPHAAADNMPSLTVSKIEKMIRDKAFGKASSSKTNVVDLMLKLFSDGLPHENRIGRFGETVPVRQLITKDQFRYCLWKRLKLNLSDDDIDNMFLKYDKKRIGHVMLFDLIEGIINEPVNMSNSDMFNKTRGSDPAVDRLISYYSTL